MKKNILLIILLSIVSVQFAYTQNYSAQYLDALAKEKARRKSKPINLGPRKYLGEASNEFLYFYVASEPESNIGFDDYYILQVSPKYSLISQYGQYQIDSLAFTSPDHSWVVDNLDFLQLCDEINSQYDYVLRNHEKNDSLNVLRTAGFGVYLQYEEEEPSFNWVLTGEAKQIGSLNCKRATCSFRGRDWEAWYTEEIPIPEGPWKFCGLPGLIVQIRDTEGHHVFTLNKIRETKTPMGFRKERPRKLSREKVNEIILERKKNPVAPSINGKIVPLTDINGNPIKPAKQFTNFIERE